MSDAQTSSMVSLFSEGMTVRLLNVYKGLPIANDAVITRVEPSTVCVSSIKAQVVCMFLDRETYIQNSALPGIVRASVLQLDTTRMEVRLGNLSFARGSIGDRKQVRVEPVDMLQGYVQPKNLRGMVKAELADISQNGLAVYLPRQVFLPDVFKPGAEMILHLTLPISAPSAPIPGLPHASSNELVSRFSREHLRGTSELTSFSEGEPRRETPPPGDGKLLLRAQVRNIKVESAQARVRVGMSIFPNLEAQTVIGGFIRQRQSELVREVRTLYDLLNKFEK